MSGEIPAGPVEWGVPAPGNGLAGIAERVRALSGRVVFTRSPRSGFRMEVWLPAGSEDVLAAGEVKA